MRSTRFSPSAESLRAPSKPAASERAAPRDELGFYRLLASIPMLATYRAKVHAIVLAGTIVPAFLLMLVLVLGAGRWSILAVLGVVVVLFGIAAWAMLRALDRLLAPFDAATRAIDDIALERPLARVDVPGSDTAA